MLGALLVAAIFLGTNNASTVQPVVDTERTVFFRERSAGCYAAYPFALAQILVEVPPATPPQQPRSTALRRIIEACAVSGAGLWSGHMQINGLVVPC